jgi:hypothetical protein
MGSSDWFHGSAHELAASSAGAVAPLVMNMFHPKSIVDVGCGGGAWLLAFQRAGVDDFLGIDSPRLEQTILGIPIDHFRAADLTKPVELGRRFDLAVSLEVAEHLSEAGAGVFVESLVTLSDRVLFSAAIPGQTGPGHVNEQWQSYWAARFERHGYGVRDAIRPLIWHDHRVAWWYRQNVLVFERGGPNEAVLLDVVHPTHLAWRLDLAKAAQPAAAPSHRPLSRSERAKRWGGRARRQLRRVIRRSGG